MHKPSDSEVEKVMDETGMDWVQAYHHLQQRAQIQADLQRNPPRYSMGKSAYDSDSGDSFCPYATINS